MVGDNPLLGSPGLASLCWSRGQHRLLASSSQQGVLLKIAQVSAYSTDMVCLVLTNYLVTFWKHIINKPRGCSKSSSIKSACELHQKNELLASQHLLFFPPRYLRSKDRIFKKVGKLQRWTVSPSTIRWIVFCALKHSPESTSNTGL